MSARRTELSRDDVAEFCGQLAALSRAGLPAGRIWTVLAEGRGPSAEVAATVAGMLALGGSVADGLVLAGRRVTGPGAQAMGWLAVAIGVAERTGAPVARVLEQVAGGLLEEVSRADEREVALAGPRATATVLGLLPLVGLGMGALLGADALGLLVGTPPGWACAVAGATLWLTGRAWTRHLVHRAGHSA